jgi:hypothetical protein
MYIVQIHHSSLLSSCGDQDPERTLYFALLFLLKQGRVVWLRLVWNSESSCLSLLSVGNTGVHHWSSLGMLYFEKFHQVTFSLVS